MTLEAYAVGKSQSNGSIEHAVQQIQGLVRTMRDALESRYMIRMDGNNHLLPWMVMHAAASCSRFNVGKDGETPYERVKGKPCQRKHIELGECVAGLRPGINDKFKADVRWMDGVYLGMRDRTDEYLIGTAEGVIEIRTISHTGTA